MKKQVILISVIILAVACGQADKKAQLEKLMAQRQKLDQQIEQLKAETNYNDSTVNEKFVNVSVTEMQPVVFKNYVEVQGKIDAEENTEATPQSPGVVEAIYVKEGDHVKKGQTLAELDAKVLKQSMEEVKIQLDFATNLYNKQKSLWDKNIGSEVQYLTAKNNMESLQKRYATLQDQVNLSKITAPISGTIESIPFKVGQLISPGMPGAAIRVVNMSRVKVVADLSESYAPRLKNGNETIVVLPDFGKELRSKLSFTSRYIDPVNRTFRIETRLNSNDIEFRANMIALMKINDYTSEKAMVLPVSVVQKSQQGQFVLVAVQRGDSYVAAKKMVTQGNIYNGSVEILSGLETGDRVITTGYQNLKEGQTVKF